jgi:hypothetical protein
MTFTVYNCKFLYLHFVLSINDRIELFWFLFSWYFLFVEK